MKPEEVTRVTAALRAHAEHFVQSDWNYTRLHDIKHIRMEGDYSGYDHPARRLARTVPSALGVLLPIPGRRRGSLARMLFPERDLRSRLIGAWATLRVGLRTQTHRPDGVLDGGNVITGWEETGEYLQFVQPSVGSKIADFLESCPDHPHAQAIAVEMDRIIKAYAQRCEVGEVDGRGQG